MAVLPLQSKTNESQIEAHFSFFWVVEPLRTTEQPKCPPSWEWNLRWYFQRLISHHGWGLLGYLHDPCSKGQSLECCCCVSNARRRACEWRSLEACLPVAQNNIPFIHSLLPSYLHTQPHSQGCLMILHLGSHFLKAVNSHINCQLCIPSEHLWSTSTAEFIVSPSPGTSPTPPPLRLPDVSLTTGTSGIHYFYPQVLQINKARLEWVVGDSSAEGVTEPGLKHTQSLPKV